MSIPTYEKDAYLTRLEVEVVRVGDEAGRPYAVLDDTLLYPEGGGQPADHGRLGSVAVVDVQRTQGEVRHLLEAPCEPGATVLTLDWQRRYDHMQQHTAQHLLSSLALTRFGWTTRSFHLGPRTSDIELDAPSLSAEELTALEDAAVAEIVAARQITTRRVTPEEYERLDVRSRGLPTGHSGDIRLVEIAGVDLNTCGGTHLRSTSEVEALKLLRTERLRGGTRVHWVAGSRLRRRLASHETRNAELRSLFDSDDESLVEIARLKLEQLNAARRRVRHLEGRLAEADLARLLDRAPAKTCLLTASGKKGASFLLVAGSESPLDAGRLGPRIAEILEGRGGGSGAVFQGKAGSLDKRAEAVSLLRRELTAAGGD
jgi:Ser-tRNA(Ala) deacylase AlaX